MRTRCGKSFPLDGREGGAYIAGPDEVRMANDNNAKFGWDATISSVNFRVRGGLTLVSENGIGVKRQRR
jgi:hypothetical protein